MNRILVLMLLLFWLIASVWLARATSPQGSTPPDRAESEKVIRAIMYEMSIATLTGDLKTFRKYSAQRTLSFYDLFADELLKDSKLKEHLGRAGVTDRKSFMEFNFRAAANRMAKTPRILVREFFNYTEAKAETKSGVVRFIRESGDWKADSTEVLKKGLLTSLPLGAESKAKLEKF